MKKIITMAVLIFSSMLTYACTGGAEQKQAETQKTAQEGSVIVMNKAMFIKDIFDYEKSKVKKPMHTALPDYSRHKSKTL